MRLYKKGRWYSVKAFVRLSILAILFSVLVGCANTTASKNESDNREDTHLVQQDYVSTKVLSVKNDSWKYCGPQKVEGFIARVGITGLQGGLKPNSFTYVEPCWAEDDLGTKYTGTLTTVEPNGDLANKGDFVIEARFTPPLKPKTRKISFSFELEPKFKIRETKYSGLRLSEKAITLEKGLVLEKVVQRPDVPDMLINILQEVEDYKNRQFSESCYLITKDGKRLSLRSLGASDPLPNGKVRNTLGFEPLSEGELVTLVAAWQLPRDNWKFYFRDVSVVNQPDAYEYPIKPGTEQWKAFSSHKEMVEACQIPENILKKMSTAGLVETVLNYPLRLDFVAYNTPQGGMVAQIEQFNGLSELLKRADAGEKLSARYQKMNPLAVEDISTDAQKGDYLYSLSYLESIMAQDSILFNLTENQKVDLLKEASRKYTEKRSSPVFGYTNKNATIWLMGKILLHTDFPPFMKEIHQDKSLQKFINDGFYVDSAVLKKIELFANQFL